jgi:hypothetical protein
MEALLLLTLLAQTPAPPPPGNDYAPPDPVLPLPLYPTRPEDDETTSPVYRTFGPDLSVYLGTDPRAYLSLFQTEDSQMRAALSCDGIGFTYSLYLGHGFALWTEGRTFLFWGTARVGLIWYPCEDSRLPLTLDISRWRILLPSREEFLHTAGTLVALELAFGDWGAYWDRITRPSSP